MLTFLKATYYYITVAPRILYALLFNLSNEIHEPLLPQYLEYAPKNETAEDILADTAFWNSVS